ncbi:head GIN domain-containing protein [Pararhodonellum marinum]|uniref:head GIN domain-containing protein n=1 Tax=Pararhodonellum marinum TaxID=2755358 RepID=UPI00188EAF3F|nr:head GIN domain-containing protein [Pararhodonellum marinum]
MAITVLAQRTETRNPGSFTKIHSGGSWDVVVQMGDKDEVRLESTNISLDKVITEVNDNTLKIYLEKGNYRNLGLTIYVTIREVQGIKSAGSGNIKVQSDILTSSLSLGNSGSGKILLKKVFADNLSVGISGSGYIAVAGGTVGEISLSQTGSGDFKGEEISVEKATITKSGSGKTQIGEVESLNVRATGSGNVYYSGSPGNQNISSSGSAKVIRR